MNISQIFRKSNFSENATSSPTILHSSTAVYPYLNQGEMWTIAIISSTLSLIGFLENFMVILALVFGEGFLDAPTNVFLLSLAMTEMLLCGVAGPMFVISLFQESFFEFFLNASRLLALVTVASIFLISCNRLVSVKYSLKYETIMTKKRAVILVALAWTMALILLGFIVASYLTGITPLRQVLRYFLIFFAVMIIAINFYLYSKSRHHRHAIAAQMQAIQQGSNKQDIRAIKSILLITGTFFLTWIPITIAAVTTKRFTDPEPYFQAFFWTAPLGLLNAALDPVIYFFRSDDFKRFYQLIKRRLFPNLEQTQVGQVPHIESSAAVISS